MSCSLVGEVQKITIREGSLAHKIYETESVNERFNCSCSLNEDYRSKFEESDLSIESFPHPVIVSFLRAADG